jgi:hypothetical protein
MLIHNLIKTSQILAEKSFFLKTQKFFGKP